MSRIKLLFGVQILWLATVLALGVWWTRIALMQATRIAALEEAQGLPLHEIAENLEKTRRMFFWESSTYLVLVAALSFFLIYLYSRDLKRSRSVSAFFASLTHELRTPLTSIRLQAESIADLSQTSPDLIPRLAQRLLEDSARIEAQVNQTLELARLEGGGQLMCDSHPLASLVESTLEGLKRSSTSVVKIDLQIDPSIREATALVDPTSLEIIFRNFIENAERHSAPHYRASFHLRQAGDAPDELELWAQTPGSRFAGNPKKLGELFYRGDNAGPKGAGVGLYLIRTLMERMGGRATFVADKEGFSLLLRWHKQ